MFFRSTNFNQKTTYKDYGEIRTYNEFLKYTEEEHPSNHIIKITSEILVSLNLLKAKIKYRDSQLHNIKDKLIRKLSKEQFPLIEPEINNIPGN